MIALVLLLLGGEALALKPVQPEVSVAKMDGNWMLLAETFLKNGGPEALRLRRVRLEFLSDGGRILQDSILERTRLRNALTVFDASGELVESTRDIPPGGSAVLLCDGESPGKDSLPRTARAWIEPDQEKPRLVSFSIRAFAPDPSHRFPLKGGRWRCLNGPSTPSHHRRAFDPNAAGFGMGQRYALDIVKVNGEGWTYERDTSENGNFLAYGAEVLATAPGKVVAVEDGCEENQPLQMNPKRLAGNRVAIDHGGGIFSHFAHLKLGSPRVKIGEEVRAGQVIGLLGNSGNSSEPHLHFALTDGPDVLQSQGLPCVFTNLDEVDEEAAIKPLGPGEMPRSNRLYESR